ncbi:MAG TPA: carboxymuconolactone decarboxylase family protein [Herpetosiphonaceae bacterium]
MTARLDYATLAPEGFKRMLRLSAYPEGRLEHALLELVKLRASQLNGCAFCLDMHWTDARKAGETELRLALLPAWRDAPCYTPRERAALAWTEALTRMEGGEVPDELYAQAAAQFSEQELVDLTYAVTIINGWNRLNVAFRTPPRPAEAAEAAR